MIDILNRYNIGKKKLIGIGILIILFLIVLPLTLIQVQKQQEIRQRAAESEFLHLKFDQPRKTVKKDEIFTVSLLLSNPKRKDTSGIDVVINYDSDKLSLNSFQPRADFLTTIISDTSVPGKIHYVGVNSDPSLHLTDGFYFGSISFAGKEDGSATVDFSDVIITASGETEPLVINPQDNKPGIFTIGEPTPSPATTSISPSIYSTPRSMTSPAATSPSPQAPKIELTLDKQIYFEGDTVGVSFKVDSIADGIALFYGASDEIPTNKINGNFNKYCDPKKECSGSFSVPVPEGNLLKIIVKAYPENQIGDAVKSLPIRHFSANVNPSAGSPGTLFTITVKTEINSEVKAVVNGPGINNVSATLYDDGNHGDGVAKDGVYGYVFHSPESKIGTYIVSFIIDNQEVSVKTSFVTQYYANACLPFINNGDAMKKIGIVVIPDNYSESELNQFQAEVLPRHINFLFSKEPYLSDIDKFNVWFVKKSSSIDCAYGKWDCVPEVEKIVAQTCPFVDKGIVLDKNDRGGYGHTKIAVINAASIPGSEGTTVHEFGHTFGQLADEYKAEPNRPSDTSKANCDKFACPKWCSGKSSYEEPKCNEIKNAQDCKNKSYNGVGCIWDANVLDSLWGSIENKCDYPYFSNINFGQSCSQNNVCLYGCAQSGGYRSSNKSVMGDTDGISTQDKEYNTVSKNQIQKIIDLFWKQKGN